MYSLTRQLRGPYPRGTYFFQSITHGSARRPSVGWRTHCNCLHNRNLDPSRLRKTSPIFRIGPSVSTTTQQPPYRVHSYHIPDHPEQDSSQEFQLPDTAIIIRPCPYQRSSQVGRLQRSWVCLAPQARLYCTSSSRPSSIRISLLIFRMCVFGRHKPFSWPRHKKGIIQCVRDDAIPVSNARRISFPQHADQRGPLISYFWRIIQCVRDDALILSLRRHLIPSRPLPS